MTRPNTRPMKARFRSARRAVACAFFALTVTTCLQAAQRPNFIVFFTDDQGWTDTSVRMLKGNRDSASRFIRTPNLERMAAQGMIFSSGYSPSPVCSPSRDSLLYGQTPTRLRHSILLGKAEVGPEALTIPRALKSVDPRYVTAHFGKWACSPKTPEDAGFDQSDGDTDNWHGDWRKVEGEKAALPEDDPKRIFSVTRRAVSFLEEQARSGHPFYLRVSHYALHVGHDALPQTVEEFVDAGLDPAAALYSAMAEDLDTGFGLVLDKVESLGLADNTYIIFTSDNGGGFGNPPNRPLRGGKASLWEGGIRVPLVVRGPGIKQGTYCDVPVAGWDFLPTLYDLAGGRGQLPETLDGGSLRSLFEKGNRGKVRRNVQALMFHYPWFDSVPMSVIRSGDHKLVKDLNTDETRLFNVAEDPGEIKDLSGARARLATRLHEQLIDYLREVNAEKLEDLRRDREQTLQTWVERDSEEIEALGARVAAATEDPERQAVERKLEELKRRLNGNRAALQRVEQARQLTAW